MPGLFDETDLVFLRTGLISVRMGNVGSLKLQFARKQESVILRVESVGTEAGFISEVIPDQGGRD
ncbi:MAG: hypothetical protein CME31_26000 [Gimesia sp.]|uniref:Uncharacterized protein n=1 Tax=Gimesia maris TaxID=122 RepID=A0A3D3R140_9PLAN|nr:hypothetical protein [Gimesia sp.]HCO21802.1 hypothetical protein [Gimesia maris]